MPQALREALLPAPLTIELDMPIGIQAQFAGLDP